jgi:hypothetical protein
MSAAAAAAAHGGTGTIFLERWTGAAWKTFAFPPHCRNGRCPEREAENLRRSAGPPGEASRSG